MWGVERKIWIQGRDGDARIKGKKKTSRQSSYWRHKLLKPTLSICGGAFFGSGIRRTTKGSGDPLAVANAAPRLGGSRTGAGNMIVSNPNN
jgi:hypothetical protein